jgi:GntR family transcriptional regulator
MVLRGPDHPRWHTRGRMADSQHSRITADLRDRIGSGRLAPGTAVASEAELSAEFGVSRGTVRQALAALRAEGLISGGRGRRPVVARPTLSQSFDQMVSFSAWARRAGRVPGARTLELARRPCPAPIADALGVAAGAPVFEYKRVRLLDAEPAMVELSTFVEPVGRLLLDFDLDAESVYEQLGARGVILAEADQEISAVGASAEMADLLAVPRRAPLLQVRRRVFDSDGTPVELSRDSYRGDIFSVTVHNRIALARAGVSLSVAQQPVEHVRGVAE